MMKMEKNDPDLAALEAIADYIAANPGMTFHEACRRLVVEKPHLVAPTDAERQRPN